MSSNGSQTIVSDESEDESVAKGFVDFAHSYITDTTDDSEDEHEDKKRKPMIIGIPKKFQLCMDQAKNKPKRALHWQTIPEVQRQIYYSDIHPSSRYANLSDLYKSGLYQIYDSSSEMSISDDDEDDEAAPNLFSRNSCSWEHKGFSCKPKRNRASGKSKPKRKKLGCKPKPKALMPRRKKSGCKPKNKATVPKRNKSEYKPKPKPKSACQSKPKAKKPKLKKRACKTKPKANAGPKPKRQQC